MKLWQFIWWGRLPCFKIWGPYPKDWKKRGYPRPIYDIMWYFGLFEIRRFTPDGPKL